MQETAFVTKQARHYQVAIVILNWNRAEDTLACLQSVAGINYPEVRVIVVDNGSTDNSPAAIRSTSSDIQFLEMKENLGYAQGNNVGIRAAIEGGADFVLLLNNDAILATDALTHLVSIAERYPNATFFGPRIIHADRPNHIQSTGGTLDWLWRSRQRGLDEEDRGQYGTVQEVDYVIGAAVLVRTAPLAQIGLLDPDFFMYREDVDWCLRARKHGCQVLYVPEACAWHRSHHVREQELPRITYYMTRNSLLLLKKNGGGVVRFIAVLARHLITATLWTLSPKWRHKRVERNALLKGLVDFFLGRVGMGYE